VAILTVMERHPSTGQSYRERGPAPILQPYLTCVWVQQVAADSVPYSHRTVPNGSAEIVCQVGDVPWLVGPQTGPTEDLLSPGTTVVGVRFRPGAAPAVLGVPASELVDQSFATAELWGSAAEALGERVFAAGSPRDAAAVVEAEIVTRLARAAADPDPIAAEVVRRLGPGVHEDVASLTSALYISERQLRRRCAAAIGLAPKVLQRTFRFQAFLALAQDRAHPSTELARLATDAGFADQSHLTRESVRLAGVPPGQLMRESERNCKPAHDHAASYGSFVRAHASRFAAHAT
jgi:AraC-like DNA-binding protein